MSAFDRIKHMRWNDKDGNISELQPFEKIIIPTSLGEIVPIYSVEDFGRKKLAPIRFYNDGAIRSVSLQEPTTIQTSVGEITVELVTFYRDGSLCRAFPLNGKLSGYWTEENERKLAENLVIPTPVGEIKVKPIYLHFYETGELKSLTFWPGERVIIPTPLGPIPVRKGVSFHKGGSLASCEPDKAHNLKTPIGLIEAFDPNPNGMCGEKNSIEFSEDGRLVGLSTSGSSIKIQQTNASGVSNLTYEPSVVRSMCSDSETSVEALKIEFLEESVIFRKSNGSEATIALSADFTVEPFSTFRPLVDLACCTL